MATRRRPQGKQTNMDVRHEHPLAPTMQLAFATTPIEPSSNSLSKFGGLATFPSLPPSAFASCGVCGSKERWCLLTQFEAPMEGASERGLWVFGCNSGKCNGKRGNVRCLRGQRATVEKDNEVQVKLPKRVQQPKQKPVEPAPKPVQPFIAPTFGSANSPLDEEDWDSEPSSTAFGAQDKLAEDLDALLSLREEKQRTTAFSYAIAASKQPTKDSNVSNAIGFTETTSSSKGHLELPPGDPATWATLPSLPCFALEWDYDASASSSDSEPSSSIELSENGPEEADFAQGGKLEAEQYEKAVYPKGMSKTFRNFQKAISGIPDQAVRYDGDPLYFSSEVKPGDVGKCGSCGGKRAYEFQLMPSILSTLQTMDMVSPADQKGKEKVVNPALLDTGLEFGTVLVYTCVASCSRATKEGWSWVEEQCVVQMEE